MNVIKKVSTVTVLILAGSLIFTGCGDSESTAPVSKPAVTEEVQKEPVTEVPVEVEPKFTAVEEKYIEIYRKAIPDTALTDFEIVDRAHLIATELKEHLADGGTGSEFVTARITADPSVATALTAEIAGAIAIYPEIATDSNYLK